MLLNERIQLRRRYMLAKDQLKAGMCVPEALAVLHQVVEGRSMSRKRKDMALRLLARYERKHGSASPGCVDRGVMRLPESWKEVALG